MKPVTFIQLDGQLIPRPYFREKEINVVGNFRGFLDFDFFIMARNWNKVDGGLSLFKATINPKI